MDTNVNNVVVALVAVGREYVEEIIPYYNKLKQTGYNVKVLTDEPLEFNLQDTTPYTKHIFNYFDKIYFSLSLVREYNQTVIYIDGSLPISSALISEYINNLGADFYYIDSWPLGDYRHYHDKANFRFLNTYLDLYKIPIKNYPTIQERVMIFNKSIDHQLVVQELEKIQPVFDYMALLNYAMYSKPFVLGDAEGLALSIVLDQNNITLQKITVKKVASQEVSSYI